MGELKKLAEDRNFVFDQSQPITRHAVMAQLTIHGDSLQAVSIPVEIRNNKPQ